MNVVTLLTESDVALDLDHHTNETVRRADEAAKEVEVSRGVGGEIKNGNLTQHESGEFLKFVRRGLKRPLLSHQVKAALHLLNVAHTANFSTPGAGKTSVVLAVYEYLRSKGVIALCLLSGPAHVSHHGSRSLRQHSAGLLRYRLEHPAREATGREAGPSAAAPH